MDREELTLRISQWMMVDDWLLSQSSTVIHLLVG